MVGSKEYMTNQTSKQLSLKRHDEQPSMWVDRFEARLYRIAEYVCVVGSKEYMTN